MDIFGPIVSFIEPIKKYLFKRFAQPKVFIIIKRLGGGSKLPGDTLYAPLIDDEVHGKVYDGNEKTTLDLVTWYYEMKLRNNSQHIAFNLELIKPELTYLFEITPPIDRLKPIAALCEETHKLKITRYVESYRGSSSIIKENHPSLLTDNYFVLKYTNSSEAKYVTVFNFLEEESKLNSFMRLSVYEKLIKRRNKLFQILLNNDRSRSI